jgi:hypothetical protein
MYFALSAAGLFSLNEFFNATRLKKFLWFSASIGIGIFAYRTRGTGIVFFPAIALLLFLHPDFDGIRLRFAARIHNYFFPLLAFFFVVVAAILVLISGESQLLALSDEPSYFRQLLSKIQSQGLLALILGNMQFRLREIVSVFANLPDAKVAIPTGVIYVTGIGIWLATFGFCRAGWKYSKPVVVYFMLNVLLLFAWPFYDTRFWLPLLPAFFLILLFGINNYQDRKHVRGLTASYVLFYVMLGLAALAYSTNISLSSNKRFVEVFGDGTLRMTYRYAFCSELPINEEEVNRHVLEVLRIYATPDNEPPCK